MPNSYLLRVWPSLGLPTTATLSMSSTATTDVALSGTITLNATADQNYTASLSISDGGVLSTSAPVVTNGTMSIGFTATWGVAGSGRTVTLNSMTPTLTVAGSPATVTVSDAVVAGAWEQLTVAPHSRKVIGESITIGSAFDATIAETIDARGTSTVSAVPYRSFCRPVMGEPGNLYYYGSLHSNYPGNEIDRIDISNLASTVVSTTISHQPRVSPQGVDSGYGSGSGLYVYRQYGTALADPSDWQPYTQHTWTKNGWHPTWGFMTQGTYALSDGVTVGANPAGAGSAYQQSSETQGLWSYDFTEGKYKVRVPTAPGPNFADQGPGISGLSDWNQHRMSTLGLANYGGYTYVTEVINNDSTKTDVYNFDQAALSGTTWGWADATSGNGVLVKWMEASKYLCIRADFNKFSSDPDTAYQTIFLINLAATPQTYLLTPPSSALTDIVRNGNGNITFAVDRNSRRVFWCVFMGDSTNGVTQTIRFYVSEFDDLLTWVELSTTGLPAIVHNDFEAGWLASNREPMRYYNGHLFLDLPQGNNTGGPGDPGYTNQALNMWRVKVDAGEALPAITFNRYDYWAQNPATSGFRFSNTSVANLQMIGTKHVNWAYSPADGIYYQHAGDFGMSTCQSMCTLEFTGAAPNGYTFTEILDEDTNAPSGKVRPSSPDDGHWFYVPTDSAWTAGRGKFVWMRGGDGEPMFYNAVLRNKYVALVGGASSSDGTIAQVTQALADGWDLASKLYLFDPATTTFTPLGATHSFDTSACTPPSAAGATFPVLSYDGWTQSNGSTFWPDVWTASSSSSRNGYFDPTTGCLWRFYINGGLAKFDMVNKAVTMFNVSNWVSDETGRQIFLNGSSPGTTPVEADGTKPLFCWQDASDSNRWKTYGAFEWEHKATWIDPATGYLYVVSPGTGYLWRFDTRATPTDAGNGWVIPFGPVGNRIPFNGAYPAMDSFTQWPPALWGGSGSPNNARVQAGSLLLPFKGGLLFLSALSHDSGVSGIPHYAMWRRLGYTGDWSVITMPSEFAANAGAAKTPYSIDNDEVLAISQAFTDIETRQFYRYFWRLT